MRSEIQRSTEIFDSFNFGLVFQDFPKLPEFHFIFPISGAKEASTLRSFSWSELSSLGPAGAFGLIGLEGCFWKFLTVLH